MPKTESSPFRSRKRPRMASLASRPKSQKRLGGTEAAYPPEGDSPALKTDERLTRAGTKHPTREEAQAMSKSKSSAAVKAPPPVEPSPVDAPMDDDFEADAPPIGAAGPTGDLDLVEEEVELEGPQSEGAPAEDADTLSPPKPPSDKEIEEGGGDSMLARYF